MGLLTEKYKDTVLQKNTLHMPICCLTDTYLPRNRIKKKKWKDIKLKIIYSY
jgi:hypothetical protein